MSRRVPTDSAGRRGPQSSRQHGGRDERHRDDDRRGDRNDRPGSANANINGIMPSMPFPMNFGNMPNGMPMFPPGFQLPGFPQQNNQE